MVTAAPATVDAATAAPATVDAVTAAPATGVVVTAAPATADAVTAAPVTAGAVTAALVTGVAVTAVPATAGAVYQQVAWAEIAASCPTVMAGGWTVGTLALLFPAAHSAKRVAAVGVPTFVDALRQTAQRGARLAGPSKMDAAVF